MLLDLLDLEVEVVSVHVLFRGEKFRQSRGFLHVVLVGLRIGAPCFGQFPDSETIDIAKGRPRVEELFVLSLAMDGEDLLRPFSELAKRDGIPVDPLAARPILPNHPSKGRLPFLVEEGREAPFGAVRGEESLDLAFLLPVAEQRPVKAGPLEEKEGVDDEALSRAGLTQKGEEGSLQRKGRLPNDGEVADRERDGHRSSFRIDWATCSGRRQ